MHQIKVDWQELEDAFQDVSNDHRYYLDRETGAVHFFSTYLDNDQEQEDEQRLNSEGRYVKIPLSLRKGTWEDQRKFVSTLQGEDRERLGATLDDELESRARFEEALCNLPVVRRKWGIFFEGTIRKRVERWLTEVGVQPL